MNLFLTLFTVFMLLVPAGVSLLIRPSPGAQVDREEIRRRRLQLWFGTALSLAVVVAVRLAVNAGWLDGWGRLPRWITWSERPDQLLWLLFFPLWFGLFVRLVFAVRPDAVSPFPEPRSGPVQRTASLQSRRGESPVRAGHWALVWAGWGIAVLMLLLGVWNGLPAGVSEHLPPMLVLLMLGLAPLPLVIGPWVIRMLLLEPEPLDDGGSADLREAYARHRQTKAWGFYWLDVAMVFLFSAMPLAAVWAPVTGPALGAVGGIGGSLVGLGGAFFGVRMGVQRMRIKEHLEELVRGQESISGA